MATISLFHVLLVTFCYALYKIISSLVATRRFQAFACKHGCEEPLIVRGSYVQALGRIRQVMCVIQATVVWIQNANSRCRRAKKTGEDFFDDNIAPDFNDAATIQTRLFDGETPLSTVEPANLQAMLATQFKDFEVGERRHDVFRPIIGTSIFSSDGAIWEHSRALFRPQFSRDNINDLEMTDRAVDDLIAALGTIDATGWTENVDLMPLLYNFTLDTATHFLFGESINCQAVAIEIANHRAVAGKIDPQKAVKIAEAQNFAHSVAAVNTYMLRRIHFGHLAKLAEGAAFRKAISTVRDFTEHFVKLACNMPATIEKEVDKKRSLLNSLATQTQDRTELRDQTLAILFAGRDTTASMLSWCIIRLALHPDIHAKLRNAILSDFKSGREITFATLKSCKYLQHFLNEVLRLHPTVPLNTRSAVKDTTLPVGGGKDQMAPVAVRRGRRVLFSVYVMHRRKDLWGEDALEFKPERWEQRIPAWQFLPFLGGPRICIGQQFALTEAGLLLVRVLQQFDSIEPVDRVEMARFKKGFSVTMWPGDGVKVRLRKASV